MRLLCLALVLATCASCSAPAADSGAAGGRSTVAAAPEREPAANPPGGTLGGDSDLLDADPARARVGKIIRECDSHLRTWTELMAQPRDEENRRQLDLLTRAFVTLVVRERAALEAQAVSGGPRNRAIASAALGFSGDASVLPFLASNAGDPDPDVAAKALLGIGVLAHASTPLAPLASALERADATQEMVSNVAFALLQIVLGGATDPGGDFALLAAQLAQEPSPAVRAQAVLSLGVLRAESTLDQLADLLAMDPAPSVRTAAAYALGQIGSPAASRALVQALNDGDRITAGTARASLARIHGSDLGPKPAAWNAALQQ